MDITTAMQLDDLILAEVNVKILERVIARTEKGIFALLYDRKEYSMTLDGKRFESPKLLEETIKRLYT